MANLFVEIEIIVYEEIVGDPVFGIYDDEGQIQDEGNDFAVKDVGSLEMKFFSKRFSWKSTWSYTIHVLEIMGPAGLLLKPIQ